VGLLTRDDEWPAWINAYERVRWLVFCLVVAGFGIFYFATGNTFGRLIGVGLLLFALIPGALWLRRRFANPS
jgi:hypothetical protein